MRLWGRTGKLFAIEHYGVERDILCSAKGIADGFPLACSPPVRRSRTLNKPGDHLSTFGGNPVCCAASLANINFMERVNLWGHAAEVGAYAMTKFRELQKDNPIIGDVRGKGLMIGIELVKLRKKA